MPHTRFQVTSLDGLSLHGETWAPEQDGKAILCLVHGIGEHCGRYEPAAHELNQAGYVLTGLDLRGHGKSEGKRGHAPDYEALMSDITILLTRSRNQFPDTPVFLYGHSLGGNLVLHYLLKEQPQLTGALVTSPLLRLAFSPPAWKTRILSWMKKTGINCSVSRGMNASSLSRDPDIVKAYNTDPLVHDRITPDLAIDMLHYGRWNLSHAAELSVPLLLMHGRADRITSAEASQEFSAAAGSLCELKVWDGFYHELHNEPEKKEVLRYMLEWLNGYS